MSLKEFNVWDGVYASFDGAPSVGDGFAGSIWRERSLQAARNEANKLTNGRTLDYSLRQRNAILPVVTAMLLSRQARVRILDFGGGLGTAFMVLKYAIGNEIERVDYHVVEIDGICRAGRDLFGSGIGPAFESELPAQGGFDIVYASSVMQYIEDWRGAASRLAGYGAPYLLFGDVFIGSFTSFVTLQNYYDSRIAHWFINEDEFITEIRSQHYNLALRSTCDACIFGVYGRLPMDNFPVELRLPHTAHLLFAKLDKKS